MSPTLYFSWKSSALSYYCVRARRLKAEAASPDSVVQGLRDDFKNDKRECFGAVFLNTKKIVISDEVISIGSLDAALVHPREVFRPAVACAASSIILMHNHPSGDPAPSTEDMEIAERLLDASKILGIELLDFITIGKNTYLSFEREGFL